jgi:hypothetical protein
MRKSVIIAMLTLVPLWLIAQNGGEDTYAFLGLTNSAKVAALGGEVVSLADDDINLVFHNPALLSGSMHNHLTLNYVDHLAGVNVGYAAYAYEVQGIGNFSAGMHYVNYGNFDWTDEYGASLGTFRASEYALNLVYSRSILDSLFTVGVNLKPVYSSLERYSSLGILMDVGLVYHNPRTLTTLAFVAGNMGTQLTTYTGRREKVPFEMQAGITQGLAHAPFRFTITYRNIERWNLSYEIEDDSVDPLGEETQKSGFDVFGDQLMRHLVFGVEFLLGDNFHVDLGYNYKMRKEMAVVTKPGMVGFSWGFGFRISKFHLAYGRSSYHLAGGTNHFSLTTNLSDFYRRK